MPDISKSNPTTQPEVEITKAASFVKIYANSAFIEVTPWDFKMIFGEIQKIGIKMHVEQSVAVVMSPQHAKALLNVLATNVQEYEKQVGEIRLAQQPSATAQEPPKVSVTGAKTN